MNNIPLYQYPVGSERDGLVCQALPLDAVQTTFELGKREAAQHLYPNAIAFFSHAITEVQHTLLSILHAHRASAYKKHGEYEKALGDANRAIELTPNLPDGYIQAAEVLQRQGKDGKALVTLNNMVNSVSKGHPLYDTFYTWKQSLEKRVEERNNHLLQRFSYDILNRIFSYLSLEDCVTSASTCKSWRRFFDNWSPMYREITLTFELCRHIRHALKPARLKDSLRVLEMDDLVDEASDALEFLVSAGCSRIESISTPYESERRWVNEVPRFFTALNDLIQLSSHHLSRLLIHLNHYDVLHVAASALDTCLNLTELVVSAWGVDEAAYKPPRWPNRRLRLTRLFLSGWQFSRTEFHDLLKFCPDLKCLGLSPRDMGDHNAVLSTVYDCCPRLEWLSYNDNDAEPFNLWPNYVVTNTGLRDFHVDHQVRTGVDSILSQFFRLHHRTLESIMVNPSATEPAHACFKTLAGLGAPSLVWLQLTNNWQGGQSGDEELGLAVAALVKTTPVLNKVFLRGIDLQGWDKAFENMAALRRLKDIKFEHCTNLPKDGLSYLFARSPRLQSLYYFEGKPRHLSVLALMEALSTKQPPVVQIYSDRLNDDVIASAFAAGWRSAVEQLYISSSGLITGKTLKLFATLPRLKYLNLQLVDIDQNDLYEYLHARHGPAKVIFDSYDRSNKIRGTYSREANGEIRFTPS